MWQVILQIYRSYFVLPILEYNSAIYNFTTAQNSQKLQRIQNRAMRIITKTDKTTSQQNYRTNLNSNPYIEGGKTDSSHSCTYALETQHTPKRHTELQDKHQNTTSKYPTPKHNYSKTHPATKGPKCGMRSQRHTKPLNLHSSKNI